MSKPDEIYNQIKERIMNGTYTAGQRLPSERELAQEFSTSRPTLRIALNRLQADSLIEVVPRGGILVRAYIPKVTLGPSEPKLPVAAGLELKKAGSFIRDMERKGRKALVRFLEPSCIMPLGEKLGEKMQKDPETEVLRRYRIHLIDRIPYRILDSYYLAEYCGGLLGHDQNYIPLFKWVRENKGLRASRAFEKISCRMPSEDEAKILKIHRNQPVVDMDRWVWGEKEDGEEILFEYTHIVANAALHDFTYDYTIDEEASQ